MLHDFDAVLKKIFKKS